MHNRERYYASLGAHRQVRPFEWGTEFVKENANGDDPRKIFREYTRKVLENSDEFLSRCMRGDSAGVFRKPKIKSIPLQCPDIIRQKIG